MENKEIAASGQQQGSPAERAATAATTPGELAHIKKVQAKRAKSKPASKPTHKAKDDALLMIGPKDYDTVVIPTSEDDPHWDPKLRNPVPEGLVDGLAEFGWDPSMAAVAIREGESLKIVHGKTRWRALAKANKLRKDSGLEPIVASVLVVDENADDLESVVLNMRRNVRLNRHVQEIDPMTLAESIVRSLSSGQEERTVAKDHAITVNDLHGYLLLTDESKCPPEVQEMLRNQQISFSAALELARRADKMTAGQIKEAAEQMAKAAAGGVKITTGAVKRAAGDGDGPATQKQKKQFLLDLQSDVLTGKHGEAATWAAIVALEMGLGTRTIESTKAALKKIAHGQTVRVDFKQYQDGNKIEEPVKGQEAPAKKHKK